MQREVLFRGWRKDGQGWAEGDLMQLLSGDRVIACSWPITHKFVFPSTVGQFTGLLTKALKKIWEGDTGLFNGKPFEVKYWDKMMAFGLYFSNDRTWLHAWEFENNIFDIEITSNIHENLYKQNNEAVGANKI